MFVLARSAEEVSAMWTLRMHPAWRAAEAIAATYGHYGGDKEIVSWRTVLMFVHIFCNQSS